MRSFAYALLFAAALLTRTAGAGDVREIELTDGSIVTGEVLSLSNGVYTIRTGSLGTLTVHESALRSIRQHSASGTSPASGAHAADIRSLEKRMMNDQEVMSLIESLRNDPDFQRILQDPDIMRAVSLGDIAALTANPDFIKLLQKSTVQDIQRKVAQ